MNYEQRDTYGMYKVGSNGSPNMSDQTWAQGIHSYYGTTPHPADLPM